MRTRTGLVLALLLAVSVAGCKADDGGGVATAGGGGKATSSAAADGLTERERMVKFAQCMRKNGVPKFPDPEFDDNGGVRLGLPKGTDPKKVEAAQQKCKKYLPNGGEPRRMNPEMMEKLRKYAKCMRANGVPKFPDPSDEGLKINSDELGMDPNDPRMKAAEKKCAKLLPEPPAGGDGPRKDRRNG